MVGVTIKSISYVGKRPIYKRRDVLLFLSTFLTIFFCFCAISQQSIANSSRDRDDDVFLERVRVDSRDGFGNIDPFELYMVDIHS